MKRGRASVPVAIFAVLLLAPGLAAAENRFAAPGGSGPEPCKRSNPCSLEAALAAPGAGSGDTVSVRAGTYQPAGGLTVGAALTVESSPALSRPLIQMPAGGEFSIANASAVVRGLDFAATGLGAGSRLLTVDRGLLERAKVFAVGEDYDAALIRNGGRIRDSVISAGGSTARGVATGAGGGSLRNLTVLASGAAIEIEAAAGQAQAVEVTNVIASGADDIAVVEDIGADVSLLVDHSNYDVLTQSGAPSVTEIAQQNAAPLLADPANGDFHQLPGSPTINAGSAAATPPPGALDLDRAQRTQGPAPDIGAYEFDQFGPDTVISDGPPATVRLKRGKKKAVVEIGFVANEPGAVFVCSLDAGPAVACTSPYVARLGRGRHSFRVFAFDRLGNPDLTAATTQFKVKFRKKKQKA